MTEWECKKGKYQAGHERYNRLHTPCLEHPKLCNCVDCMPESIEKQFEQPKSQCNCLDCNLPDTGIEALGYKPEKCNHNWAKKGTGKVCIKCGFFTEDKPGVPILAADSDGKLLNETKLRALDKHIKQNCKPEQPNTELLIIKTIQGLITCVNNQLGGLEVIVTTGGTMNEPLRLVRKALEEIDLFERTMLVELGKKFE